MSEKEILREGLCVVLIAPTFCIKLQYILNKVALFCVLKGFEILNVGLGHCVVGSRLIKCVSVNHLPCLPALSVG